jgi:hypothetical protein
MKFHDVTHKSQSLTASRPSNRLGIWLVLGLTAAVATAMPRTAAAAACCISATSFGVGRLLMWEDFAAGLQIGHARIYGQWDSNGHLRRNPPGYYEGVSQALPWAIVRLHERLELQGWAPILINDRWSNQDRQLAGGLGDIGTALRFQVLAIGEIEHLPSLAVTAGGTAPTGRRVEQTSPPLFAGTTGRGAFGGSLAIESEYAFLPWFVRVEGGVTEYAPFERTDIMQSQKYGRSWRAALSAGREVIADKVVAALALLGEWEAQLRLNGASVPDSQSHLYSLAASLSWRANPHLTLVSTIGNSIWPNGFGKNLDARLGVTVGVRYGYF